MIFWINGNFHEDTTAIAINDRGFLLGDGLFETFYVENGKACEVGDHLDRLFNSLDIMGIECAYSKTNLANAIQATLDKNAIEFGSLRLTVSRGTGPRGLLPPKDCNSTILITCVAGSIKRDEFPAINLTVSSIRRNETSPASKMKTLGGYLDNILALKEAKEAGFDDTILLNSKGHITCTTSANIFLFLNGIWHTPKVEDGILAGIYRNILLSRFQEEGQQVLEKSLTLSDLKSADKVLISNSLIGMRNITSVHIPEK